MHANLLVCLKVVPQKFGKRGDFTGGSLCCLQLGDNELALAEAGYGGKMQNSCGATAIYKLGWWETVMNHSVVKVSYDWNTHSRIEDCLGITQGENYHRDTSSGWFRQLCKSTTTPNQKQIHRQTIRNPSEKSVTHQPCRRNKPKFCRPPGRKHIFVWPLPSRPFEPSRIMLRLYRDNQCWLKLWAKVWSLRNHHLSQMTTWLRCLLNDRYQR